MMGYSSLGYLSRTPLVNAGASQHGGDQVRHQQQMTSTFRCRLPRFSRRKRFASLVAILAITYVLYVLIQWSGLSDVLLLTCEKLRAKEHLASLCSNYKIGKEGGNLCHDLCVTKELMLSDCLAHKNTTIVFTGKWKGVNIVFKTKKAPHNYQNINDILFGDKTETDLATIRKDFSRYLHEYIATELEYKHLEKFLTPQELVQKLYHPHSAESLTLADIRSLWKIIQRDEYVKFQFLQGLEHIPRIYGFCGNYYAVEKVQSLENFIGPFVRPKAWNTRAHIAREILEMFMEFRNTSLRGLVHCDIQPGNFGLSNKGRVVAIDLDTVFNTLQAKEVLGQGECSSDKDCSFFDCVSACDMKSGTCSSYMITNNLHIVCRDLYVLKSWFIPGLLNMSPIYAANKLKPVLQKCMAETSLPWTANEENNLYEELYNLLKTNLE